LDPNWFPWVKEPAKESAVKDEPVQQVQAQRIKPTWATRKKSISTPEVEVPKDYRNNGARVIIFCIGGFCANEVVSLAKLSEDQQRDVLLGIIL
jgi:hypothetical protein